MILGSSRESGGRWRRWRAVAAGADEAGTTAIEFGMVALPFFAMLFGIISVGFYYFTVFTLENAVEEAARMIRTGQVQTRVDANGDPDPMTAAQFKQLVCDRLPPYMQDCTSAGKIRVQVQNFTSFDSIAVPSCLDGQGALITDNSAVYNPGGASTVTLVTVCYEWGLPATLPSGLWWIRPNSGNSSMMANGSALIQAATTFVTEPYQ
ncbi:MAG: TadE/TadG family type IV pilus assembly protein [Hyphomicrobiaceae bacterium]